MRNSGVKLQSLPASSTFQILGPTSSNIVFSSFSAQATNERVHFETSSPSIQQASYFFGRVVELQAARPARPVAPVDEAEGGGGSVSRRPGSKPNSGAASYYPGWGRWPGDQARELVTGRSSPHGA